MNYKPVIKHFVTLCTAFIAVAQAADKPNILFIVSDDTGYGDLGPYGGGEGRGMPTPNFADKRVFRKFRGSDRQSAREHTHAEVRER